MKRGDIVTVSASGNYCKPRPAIIIQSDWLSASESVLVSLVTSTLVDAPLFRLSIQPDEGNGFKLPSQIMVDKIIAIPRNKCGEIIGRIDQRTLIALNHMLTVMVGIAD